MTIEQLKKSLDEGAKIVFAKRLNEHHNVRACYVIQFDRRKGYHVVEQKARQIRLTMENEGGIYLLTLKDDKIHAPTPYGENLVTDMPPEQEEEIYQMLPRFDLTARVQSQRLLKKIGFFR